MGWIICIALGKQALGLVKKGGVGAGHVKFGGYAYVKY